MEPVWKHPFLHTGSVHLDRNSFLTHRIRISEILQWDRKSYLIHAFLPRLSHERFVYWLYWNSRTWTSSNVIVMFKWRHHVKLHRSILRDFWKLIQKKKRKKKHWWARKRIHLSCGGRIENPSLGITVCHHSASLVMPKGDPRDEFSYPTLTLMIDSYNLTHVIGSAVAQW